MRGPRVRPVAIGSLALVLVLAGCTGPAPGAPAATAGASDPTAAPVPPTPSPPTSGAATPGMPAATPGATPTVALPSQPPAALLIPAGGRPTPGELGSFTWRNGGSDSPWVIVPTGQATRPAGSYSIDLEPPLEPVTWIAVWAPIEHGRPGTVAGYEEGTGGGITFTGPPEPGPWSLRLDVDFGRPGRATWYWRLEPAS